MESTPVPRSASVSAARERLLDHACAWIADCIREYRDAAPTNVHDQGTYTISWLPVLQARPDAETLAFLRQTRDRIHARHREAGAWQHGYWTMQEVHHGTEHFELFLATLWRLLPQDGDTVGAFADMAEHLGNWSAEVPEWFDWDTGLYRSMWFGASGLQTPPGCEYNVADFFRCANLALLAHGMTGDTRYLDLAARQAGVWADAILADPRLPAGLGPAGPVYELDDHARATYRAFAGMAGDLDDPLMRAENLLTSDAINSFLQLGKLTGDERYTRAARHLVATLATQLHDPDAGAAAAAVRDYRRATGDTRFDAAVRAAVAGNTARQVQELNLEPKVHRASRPAGVGKRTDMGVWFEDRQARVHNPVTLAVAAEIDQDAALATTALDLAGAYLTLARRCYPHGRHHGCCARSVSAIARGHGRDNNVGVLTGVLGPLNAWPASA